MRKESAEEVAEAARRRLTMLGRELGRDLEDPAGPGAGTADADLTDPVVPREPGRHSRRRPVPLTGRGVAWLQDRLPATLQGRVSLGVGHVAVLAVVAAVALAVTAYVTIRARPASTPVPQVRATPPSSTAGPLATPTGVATAGGTGGSVVVDIAGKVRRPGVTTLPAGSRVVDAIREAGGPRRGVDLSPINLARVLVDGEQILVGVAPVPGVAASASSQPGGPPGALINLNTAALTELDSLPGVGPVTAQKILDWRSAHGAFTAIDELLEVDGIGEKTLADLAPHLTL
jgi:competence protein ComEA